MTPNKSHRSITIVGALGLGLLLVGFLSSVAWGQAANSSSIFGTVTDSSGAVVPNAKVTVASSALQVSQETATTDNNGAYRFVALPAGTYTITFRATGFQPFVRQGMTLTIGFAARVDAKLGLGAVTQSVTVSGETPVVDTTSVTASTTLLTTTLQNIPLGATMQELLPMAAGVSLQGKPDVGDSNLDLRSATITYGAPLTTTLDVEGINTMTGDGGLNDTATYLGTYSVGQAKFNTSGNTADVAFAGVDQEVEMKSGSSQFHGTETGSYENPSFQGNNISPALAAKGLKNTNPLVDPYYDYDFNVGGYIPRLRNKLWGFGGLYKQVVTQGQIGFHSAPDANGCWTCADAPPGDITQRVTGYYMRGDWQLTKKVHLIGSWLHGNKFLSSNPASLLDPLPYSNIETLPSAVWKGEIQTVVSSHLLFDALFGKAGYLVDYVPQPSQAVAGNPSRTEITTGLNLGPNPLATVRPQFRYEGKGDVTWLRGAHQFKFGTDDTWEHASTTYAIQYPQGDYQLIYDNGAPFEVQLYNIPVTPVNQLHSQSLYAMDTWALKRVTLTLGVRWERYNSYFPEQNKPAGQFSSAGTFPGQTVAVWKDVVPRVGAAWDIRGDGKTVLKGFFGMFGDTQGDLFANSFNPNSLVTTTYKWSGPCVVTNYVACDISPATLATLTPSSSAFVSATGGSTITINPNLKQDKTYEYMVRLERQLVRNVGLTLSYVQIRQYNRYDSAEADIPGITYMDNLVSTGGGINVLRPPSVYTVPVQFTDQLTGAPVTVYTYPSSYAGSAFNQIELVNVPSNEPDTYNTVEAAVNKQFSSKFTALTSFWITKRHVWIQGIEASPNDLPFPMDNTWNWEARGDATYNFPLGFVVSGYYRGDSGVPGQRTETFTSSQLLQGAVTLRMEPFGAERAGVVSVLSVKVAKNVHMGERFTLQPYFEVFNLLNNSAAITTSYLTGSTYGDISGAVSPRVFRIGGSITF